MYNSPTSPLKGRTQKKRSRQVIRTGTHAIEEAKKRDDDLVGEDFASKRGSPVPSSRRRRHKAPKSSRSSSLSNHDDFLEDSSSSFGAGVVTERNHFSLNPSREIDPSRDTELVNGGNSDADDVVTESCNPTSMTRNEYHELKDDESAVLEDSSSFGAKNESPFSASSPHAIRLGKGGFSRDATMAQDVGNYRMLIDDLSYKLSAIMLCIRKPSGGMEGLTTTSSTYEHTTVTAGAACDIAEIMSLPSTRSKLLSSFAKSVKSSIGGGEKNRVGSLEAVLESIACAPNVSDVNHGICHKLIDRHSCLYNEKGDPHKPTAYAHNNLDRAKHSQYTKSKKKDLTANISIQPSTGTKFDVISSKALAIVSYFVGLDCTGSDRSSIPSRRCPSNRLVVQLARDNVLKHSSALKGIARIVANDPVVHAYLHGASETFTSSQTCLDTTQADDGSNTKVSSFSTCDPTKRGRNSRKKGSLKQASNTPVDAIFNDKAAILDFSVSDEGKTSRKDQSVELLSVDKYEEKISLSMSRMNLMHEQVENLPCRSASEGCSLCNGILKEAQLIAPAIALIAADYIITGKDKYSSDEDECNEEEYETDFCSNESVSKNPILHANEMLLLSGSLSHYSLSMAETLIATLLSFTATDLNGNNCHTCITYLQHRASLLSEVIDNLVVLSPKVSIELSKESLLVPSLLRTVAELSFTATNEKLTPFIFESTLTALKTLTSLTHENSVACNQMLNPYCWKIALPAVHRNNKPSNDVTGLDIIFSFLFDVGKQENTALHKVNYDGIIFCLNILTNIVEMIPSAKSLIESIVIVEGGAPGLSWLARWIVSKTQGFQDSVMKGSFGSTSEPYSDSDMDGLKSEEEEELKSGEESNLVLSGNGFVLLACLMIDDGVPSHGIRELILKELPCDKGGNSGGIQFMIKTLKAFCNFYHHSVGDLSVAIIAPVVKLIAGLEQIDGNE